MVGPSDQHEFVDFNVDAPPDNHEFVDFNIDRPPENDEFVEINIDKANVKLNIANDNTCGGMLR